MDIKRKRQRLDRLRDMIISRRLRVARILHREEGKAEELAYMTSSSALAQARDIVRTKLKMKADEDMMNGANKMAEIAEKEARGLCDEMGIDVEDFFDCVDARIEEAIEAMKEN
jgi:transcriptional regulator of met regulon